MDDDNSTSSNQSDYKIYYVGNDLDMDGYLSSTDTNIEDDFVGDIDDFERLSYDAPTLREWKNNNKDIYVTCNGASEDIYIQLRNEIEHIVRKIKTACRKEKVTLDDLVELKYGRESPIMNAFLSSDIQSLTNDYNKFFVNMLRM